MYAGIARLAALVSCWSLDAEELESSSGIGGGETFPRFLLLGSLLGGGPREWWSRYIRSHLSGRLCGQSVIV